MTKITFYLFVHLSFIKQQMKIHHQDVYRKNNNNETKTELGLLSTCFLLFPPISCERNRNYNRKNILSIKDCILRNSLHRNKICYDLLTLISFPYAALSILNCRKKKKNHDQMKVIKDKNNHLATTHNGLATI